MSSDTDKNKPQQHAEQKMRDERDRKTQDRTPGPGEPRMREGADKSGLGAKGWSEVDGQETPPRGGAKDDATVDAVKRDKP